MKNKIITGIVLVVAAFGGYMWFGKSTPASNPIAETPKTNNTTTDTNTPAKTNPIADVKSKYKDGTYNTTANYTSPGGKDSIGVSLTLLNGIITDATVTNIGSNPESKSFQNRFILGFKKKIIGKNIETLSVGVISGSSLTSGAFETAVAKIKSQAL